MGGNVGGELMTIKGTWHFMIRRGKKLAREIRGNKIKN